MLKDFIFLIRIAFIHMCFKVKHNPLRKKLNKEQFTILNSLNQIGYYIMPNFLTNEEVQKYLNESHQLMQMQETKIWRDKVDSDKRIYGADQISNLYLNHFNNVFINDLVDAHEKSQNKSGFIMVAQMDYKNNNPGSGDGWHKDRADKWQTKSILYLTDVNSSSGPFQYIKNSHKPFYILRDWIRYGISPTRTRFENSQINQLISREPSRLIECSAKSGTILFANTLGIHRGKPIEIGQRVAVTTYFWTNMGIPPHIQKLLQKQIN